MEESPRVYHPCSADESSYRFERPPGGTLVTRVRTHLRTYKSEQTPDETGSASSPWAALDLNIIVAGAFGNRKIWQDDYAEAYKGEPRLFAQLGFFMCAEHVRQLGGESLLSNRMEVKD